MTHLEQEEVMKILSYFKYCDKREGESIERALARLEDPAVRNEYIFCMDQGQAIDRDYPKGSLFGDNQEEIKRNVGAHLRECLHCYTEYEIFVKKLAMLSSRATIQAGEATNNPRTQKEINESLSRMIANSDFLGLLTEQE